MLNVRLYIACMLLVCMMGLVSCQNTEEVTSIPVYDGPVMVLEEIETIFSDSGITRVKMNAAIQKELQNGDREFPNGILLHFYNEKGLLSSTLRSNQAYYYKDQNKWLVRGNVVIESAEQNKKMTTEELWWDPTNEVRNKRITTSKFVTIQTSEVLMTGQGLQANEDFTWYNIDRPIGTFAVEK